MREAEFLVGYPALSNLTMMKAALRQADGDHQLAMQIAYRFLETQADPGFLSPTEIAAFGLAVGLEQPAPAAVRREQAAFQLGKAGVTSYVRASRSGATTDKTSAESELMHRVGRVLQGDDETIRISQTRETPRTGWPPSVPSRQRLHELCGTWRGVTATTNMVKALSNKSGPHETYMVIMPDQNDRLAVRWLFHEERDVPAAAVAFADMDGGMRMTCVYEVDVTYLPKQPALAHHRGACLLDRADQHPNLFSGRYFTDTGTSGILDFDAHVKEVAQDVLEAQYLFRSTAVNERRVEALQQAVERGINDPALGRLLPRVRPLESRSARTPR
jgi:hypothetical protein